MQDALPCAKNPVKSRPAYRCLRRSVNLIPYYNLKSPTSTILYYYCQPAGAIKPLMIQTETFALAVTRRKVRHS